MKHRKIYLLLIAFDDWTEVRRAFKSKIHAEKQAKKLLDERGDISVQEIELED